MLKSFGLLVLLAVGVYSACRSGDVEASIGFLSSTKNVGVFSFAVKNWVADSSSNSNLANMLTNVYAIVLNPINEFRSLHSIAPYAYASFNISAPLGSSASVAVSYTMKGKPSLLTCQLNFDNGAQLSVRGEEDSVDMPESQLASRDVVNITFTSSGYSVNSGETTWVFHKMVGQVALTEVNWYVNPDNGQGSFGYGSSHYYATINKNQLQTGSFSITTDIAYGATQNAYCYATYKVSGYTQVFTSATTTKTVYVTAKRSLSQPSDSTHSVTTIRADYAIAIASAGVAVAAVAVVAAVAIVRRKPTSSSA